MQMKRSQRCAEARDKWERRVMGGEVWGKGGEAGGGHEKTHLKYARKICERLVWRKHDELQKCDEAKAESRGRRRNECSRLKQVHISVQEDFWQVVQKHNDEKRKHAERGSSERRWTISEHGLNQWSKREREWDENKRGKTVKRKSQLLITRADRAALNPKSRTDWVSRESEVDG